MKVVLGLVLCLAALLIAEAAVPLNVHVVPHTHDDVGWLKTPDEYYYGANQSIQDAGVQYIIDTVITALQQNPARKFIYVEMAFFYRWWREQNDATRQIVKNLVASGQLEFINGGWTMHDEAAVHFEDMVDQMTLGHQFLFNTFGIVPKIGWQLDPFGHSSTSAIIDDLIGFEALFFARMDYQDENTRINNKGLEMNWRPSASIPNISILTGMMFNGYCNPGDFLWEYGSDPIQDDPLLEGYNIDAKAQELIDGANYQASLLRHNDVMLSWGCDFMYENAHMMFKNIEKLMNYINANVSKYNAKLFYSTPSIYAQAILTANPTLPLKTDDFMPYADDAHSYWSGYFVSRSTLKGYVRFSSHVLHAITSLVSTSQIQNSTIQAQIFAAQQPNGVTTHHDAVSGTEKQHVADDYAKNLNIANFISYNIFNEVVGTLLGGKVPPTFNFCPLINQSICPATQGSSGVIPIVAYNPLGWANTDYIKFPTNTSSVSIADSNGNAVVSQILPGLTPGTFHVVFLATVQALGFTTYFATIGSSTAASEVSVPTIAAAPFTISNRFLTASFDANGNFVSVTNQEIGQTVPLTQQYLYYSPNVGDSVSGQASGAYIFRPAVQTTFNYATVTPVVTVINGTLVTEVRRYFQPDLSQIIRLFANQEYIEIEDVIGPIDISDGKGKEVITRYTTNFKAGNMWYSDSNGIELLPRKTNYRPSWNYNITEPVAGNYVPVNAITTINDPSQKLQLSVVVDRSRSSASLTDGQLEMMIHRRCLVDDGRGVGEPLNESTIMASKEWLVVTNTSSAASVYRPLAKKAYHPFFLAFGNSTTISTWKSQYKTDYAPLGITLPPNVQLLNFVPLDSGAYILRFHHIYQIGEDANLSQPITFDITRILSAYTITSIQETQLTAVANALRKDAINLKNPLAISIQLLPTEIRTFVVTFELNPPTKPPVPEPQPHHINIA